MALVRFCLLSCVEDIDDASTMRESLFIIEEPEVHLHPRLAAKLSNFFNKLCSDFPGLRVIIETHSEHFLLKNQVSIKENPELAKYAQILFMERVYDSKNSYSQVHSVSFKEDGQLSRKFPDDFFDLSHKHYRDLLNKIMYIL